MPTDRSKANAAQAKWFAANKQKQRDWVNARRRMMSDRLAELKNQPCMDCGGSFPSPCMDFDHVRGEKIGNVTDLCRKGVRWETVLAEIAKCELVCANCHRLRTWQRNQEKDQAV